MTDADNTPSLTSTALDWKTQLKFRLRRLLGEPYVGKRMKMRHFARLLRDLRFETLRPRILEVGCNDGAFTDWLGRRWPTAIVEGIDTNDAQIAACARWAAASGRSNQLTFRRDDASALEARGSYDLIACFDVLEYISDDRDAIARMVRALKPGGWLLIHGPNVTYQRIDGSKHYVPPERAREIDPLHVRHGYSPQELRERLTAAGLEEIDVRMLHGRITDLAFRLYNLLEHPAPLRLLTLPFVDLLTAFDAIQRPVHGNTVFGMARKPAGHGGLK